MNLLSHKWNLSYGVFINYTTQFRWLIELIVHSQTKKIIIDIFSQTNLYENVKGWISPKTQQFILSEIKQVTIEPQILHDTTSLMHAFFLKKNYL